MRGRWKPGVSMMTSWVFVSSRFTTAVIRLRVVWGLDDTIASFCPASAFVNVDLPTLGRPQIVIMATFSMFIGSIPP